MALHHSGMRTQDVAIIVVKFLVPVSFFFFQAEDGIRDDLVTGVQTCALPISLTHFVAPGGAIMGRAPAAGKKCPHAAGEHGVREKGVKEATNAPPICCRTATNAEILRKLARLGGFSFAIGTLRGQDYPHAPSPRAKLQATRGQGPTHDGRSAPQDTAGSMGLIGGCDGAGASRPRSRLGPQIAPGKTPPSMSRFCPVMEPSCA